MRLFVPSVVLMLAGATVDAWDTTIAEYLLNTPHASIDLRADRNIGLRPDDHMQLQALTQLSGERLNRPDVRHNSSTTTDLRRNQTLRRSDTWHDTPLPEPISWPAWGGKDPKVALEPTDAWNHNQSVLNDVIGEDSLDTTSCVKHKTENLCIIDVSCGWCLQPKGGGECVPGTYVGPIKEYKDVYCPVYTTYQVYIPPDPPSSKDAFKHMFDNTGGNDDGNFDADMVPLDKEESQNDGGKSSGFELPQPDARNDLGLNPNLESDEDKEFDFEEKKTNDSVDTADADAAPSDRLHVPPPAPSRASIEPHTFSPVPKVTQEQGNFGSDTSPCGLPGVPQEFCDAWLKINCGPEHLTDTKLRHMASPSQPKANNPYDWCKLLFKNEPGVMLPEVDVFPWMINNQEVTVGDTLKEKIRFGHALAGQGIFDEGTALDLKRFNKQMLQPGQLNPVDKPSLHASSLEPKRV